MRSQDNVSFGLAEQQNKPHGIFEASGVDAHTFFHWFMRTQSCQLSSVTCSRIDLQSTKHPPKEWNYQKAYKSLAKPKKLILGDDGNTLYIGNRQSNSYFRIYDKTDHSVRVEIELKGTQAKRAWRTLASGKDIAAVYDLYLKKSRVPALMVEHYTGGREPLDESELQSPELVDLETKYLWLASLDKLVYKLAHDHDIGDRTKKLVKRWSEYGQDLDTIL